MVGLTAMFIGESRGGGGISSPESMALLRREPKGPGADAHERDVDHRGLAGALAGEEGGGDPAGDGHAAHRVAVGATGLVDDPRAVRRRGGPGAAHPAPERGPVVPALLGVRAPLAVAAAAHVDDLRDSPCRMSSTSSRSRLRASGQEVGEEDVGVLAELQEHRMAVGWSRARPMLRLPRFGCSIRGWNDPSATPPVPRRRPRCASPVTACSTLMTSAPQSVRTAPAAGVNVNWATSTILTPFIGWCIASTSLSLSLEAETVRRIRQEQGRSAVAAP